MNIAIIHGRLGRDPEIKNLQSGQMCSFSIATNEKFKNAAGELQEKTEWFNCVSFGKLAEICSKSLLKGSEVVVEGKISHNSWTDKNGVKQNTAQVKVKEIKFVGAKPKREEPNGNIKPEVQFTADDIPF